MPTIDDINSQREKKFKKRDYRPYNLDGTAINNFSNSSLLEVAPEEIVNWKYHDRPENELGDIDALAVEFQTIGQQQPCVVRPCSINKMRYELIVGERRWHAAKKAGLNLKVIVSDLSDSDAAIIQASETQSRKDLSDFAKGMSYARLIDDGILTQKDISEKLKLPKQQISRLLSFRNIPESIMLSIGNMSRISARTAEEIKQLSSKGEPYIEAIVFYASKLRDGTIGNNRLKALVEQRISSAFTDQSARTRKYYNDKGLHVFTLRKEEGAFSSIHFPIKLSKHTLTKSLEETIRATLKEIMNDVQK